MNILQEIPFYTSYLSFSVISFTLILIFKSGYKGIVSRYFTAYLAISLFVGVVSLVMAKNRIPNLPLLHAYTLLEFSFLSLFYKSAMSRVRLVQEYFYYVFWSVITLIILNSAFLQSPAEFNSFAKTLSHLVLLGFSLLFFVDRLQLAEVEELDTGLTLINAGILFYLSGSLFIFMTSNILLTDNSSVHEILWTINAVFYLIFQIIILTGVWKMLSP